MAPWYCGAVSDEDRGSTRVTPKADARDASEARDGRSDATLGRIAELAEGWSVGDGAAAPARKPALPPPRPGKTAPHPPPRPGRASEAPAARASAPPARAADADADAETFEVPVPMPAAAASKPPDEALAASPAERATPVVTSEQAAEVSGEVPLSKAEARPAAAVPRGEFDPPGRHPRDAKLELRGDPTMIDSSHLRTDQTEVREAGAKVADAGIAATLRHAPSLPRRRGLWGDLRYVFTVWLGVRRAKRELAQREREQAERETTRRRHLTAIGRSAATAAAVDQTQVRRARDHLSTVADDREKHAAAVAACDAEMEAVRKERATKAEEHRAEIEKLGEEQKSLLAKLEPLLREAAAARRKATDLRNALLSLDGKVRNVEAGRGKWADDASRAAELAALRAERQGVARDEPVIAAQLDSLVPRIASIEAARERVRRKITERNEEEEEDRKRSDELLSAIGAKRKVVVRATADAEKARERMFAELGERLYVDRPPDLAAQLAPIDSIDLELGDGQRRIMEIKEILLSVDRFKLARGILWWVLVLAAAGAAAWFATGGQLPF